MPIAALFRSSADDELSGAARAGSDSHRRLYAAVRDEIYDAFSSTAVSASITTAKALLRPVSARHDIFCYLPKDPIVSLPDSLALGDLRVPHDALSSLTVFHDSLAGAKAATLMTKGDAETKNPEHPTWLNISLLWRKTAADALAVSEAIQAFGQRFGDAETGQAGRISDLLRSVRDGGTPCVDANGDLVLPRLDERRGAQRRTVNLRAWRQVGEARHPVILANVSANGIGLTGCDGVRPGDRLAIEIPGGRLLLAVALWAQGGHVGARLIEPLNANDILLTDNFA